MAVMQGREADIQISALNEKLKYIVFFILFLSIGMLTVFFWITFTEGFYSRNFIADRNRTVNFSYVFLVFYYVLYRGIITGIFGWLGYLTYKAPSRKKKLENRLIMAEGEEYVRGSMVHEKPSVHIMKRSMDDANKRKLSPIIVAGAPFPYTLENMSMYIQGSAGSGKSQIIKQMMYDIRRRGGRDKLVIYDRKPEFLPLFYRDGDIIICPADRRHTLWDLFAEIKGEQDIDGVIKSLFPDLPGTGANDKFWIDSARGVFKGVLVWLMKKTAEMGRKPNMRDLVILLANAVSNPAKLKELLWEYEDAQYYATSIEGADNDKSTVASSVMGTLNTYVGSFTRPEVAEPGNFSIRDWLRDPNTEGQAIFLANPAKYESNYRSYYTTILDLGLKEMISMTADINRRVWFFIDEFGSLFKLDSIIRLLAEGRSKGACTIIGTQDMAQIKQQYKDEVETLINNCNSKVMARISSSDEAQYVSKMIGQIEVETDENDSLNYSLGKDGMNVSASEKGAAMKRTTRDAVLPPQIMNLPNLTYYAKFGELDWFKNGIEYYPWGNHEIFPEFIEKPTSCFSTSNIICPDLEEYFSAKDRV